MNSPPYCFVFLQNKTLSSHKTVPLLQQLGCDGKGLMTRANTKDDYY